jgi:hypothetical protein
MQRSRTAYAQMEHEAAEAAAAQAPMLAPVFDDDDEYEHEHEHYSRQAGAGGAEAELSDPGLPAAEFSLQPSVSRPGLSSRDASTGSLLPSPHAGQRLPSPHAGQRDTPPGGGFTVTTGIDPRQHSTNPLQDRLQALAESLSRRAQRQQHEGGECVPPGMEASPRSPVGNTARRSVDTPPQPRSPPLQHAQQHQHQPQHQPQHQQQQPKMPDVFQWGGA